MCIRDSEYPDIIFWDFSSTPMKLTGLLDDGIVIPMDNLIRQYAPNYLAWLESDEAMMKQAPVSYTHLDVYKRQIGYLKSLLDEGCLMSVTKDVIDYMSLEASKKDSDSKQRMYLMWDDLLGRVDNFPDKQKAVFIQAMSEVFASFEDEARNIDKGILHILTTNILLLRKQKIEVLFDAAGDLSFSLVNIEPEEQMAEVEDK